MSPQYIQPAGFRLPARTRGRVIPINIRRRRGLGDAASDAAQYAAIASKLAPGSADYQLASGCAANPTAPACSAALTGALSTPYLNATDYANTVASIAAGQGPVPLTATTFTGAPAGTSIPSPSSPQPVASVAATPSGPTITATPNVQSIVQPSQAVSAPVVQPVQPAGASQPPGTPAVSTSNVGFFSTTILGFPLWLWGVAAVGAYFLFVGGKHGRY